MFVATSNSGVSQRNRPDHNSAIALLYVCQDTKQTQIVFTYVHHLCLACPLVSRGSSSVDGCRSFFLLDLDGSCRNDWFVHLGWLVQRLDTSNETIAIDNDQDLRVRE